MKHFILLFATAGLLMACNNDDDNSATNPENDLIGYWRLIEVLADPGDGSGEFAPVESGKIITFQTDGVITSNGSLCDMHVGVTSPSTGTYSVETSTFNSPDCANGEYDYPFEQTGNILVIEYPCIEPCKAKYQKE